MAGGAAGGAAASLERVAGKARAQLEPRHLAMTDRPFGARKMRSRRHPMARLAGIRAMTLGAALARGRRLDAVIALAPGDGVVAGPHDGVAFGARVTHAPGEPLMTTRAPRPGRARRLAMVAAEEHRVIVGHEGPELMTARSHHFGQC